MKLIIPILLCLLFLSCTTNASVQLEQSESSSFYFTTEAKEGISNVIRSFTGLNHTMSIFNTGIIEESFTSAGISSVSVSSAGISDISISGFSDNLHELLPLEPQVISFSENSSTNDFTVTLNEQTMGSLFLLMGEEASLYIELLQAPLFTGEEMSSDDYLSFIGALYGDSVKEELASSVLTFEVATPSRVYAANVEPFSIGSVEIKEQVAVFSVSLYKFLSNTKEIIFRVQWKN